MDPYNVIEKVRKALGRSAPLQQPPTPPAMNEPITRLVHSEIGLSELFARRAAENKMGVELVYVDELNQRLVEYLLAADVKKLALPVSAFLEKLGVTEALRAAGFHVRHWDEMSRDEIYDFDCGITDVYRAVAETGSLVVRGSAGHGRSLSLVPDIHVAILEPKNFLPDLVDLFEQLPAAGAGDTFIITGPSKTSDIEMNLVVGVHGPRVVQVFILQ